LKPVDLSPQTKHGLRDRVVDEVIINFLFGIRNKKISKAY